MGGILATGRLVLPLNRLLLRHPILGHVSVMTNAPILYEYALVGNWDLLIKRCGTNPDEATWLDKCHNTALHLACRRQPPRDVLIALMSAYANAIRQCTVDGLTPLHFACYCGASSEIVSFLIKAFEAAPSMVDKRGRTPLHCACAGFRTRERVKVIRVLLENDTKPVLWQDEKGRTPLSLMFDDYAEEIEEAEVEEEDENEIEQEDDHKKEEETTSPSPSPQDGLTRKSSSKRFLISKEMQECWQITMLLLRAAYHGSIDDPPPGTSEFLISHAAVGVSECPSQFVQLVLKLDPDAPTRYDSKGNLPLHVACSSREKTVTSFDHSASKRRQQKPRRRSIGVGWRANQVSVLDDGNQKSVVMCLLEMNPAAAFIDNNSGKKPFLLAVESGKSIKEGLIEIIDYSKEEFNDDAVRKSLLLALSDFNSKVRAETAKNCGQIIAYWKNNIDDLLEDLLRGSRGEGILGVDERRSSREGVQATMLTALAEIIKKGGDRIEDPREDLVLEVMEAATSNITSDDEAIREAAAKTLGALADWKSKDTVMKVFYDLHITEIPSSKIDKDSTTPTQDSWDVIAIKHGKACFCNYILASQAGATVTPEEHQQMTQVVKSLMTDNNDIVVRKSACLALGGVLGRSKDDKTTTSTLKEMKSVILKTMRPTEDPDVHISISKGLRAAVRMKRDLFAGKKGLAIMDAGLMLAMSGSYDVQQAFIKFLWLTLRVGEGREGLQEYMNIAPGQNGRIMMTLVTKILDQVEDFDDD